MTDRELFEWLKREGECWHEIIGFRNSAIMQTCSCGRLDCGILDVRHRNPDFSTPDGFFWLKDRLVEKKLWAKFCLYCWGKLYGKGVKPPVVWSGSLPEEYIHPARFTAALVELLEAQGIGRKG